jgi:hypothetical protein
MAGVVWKPNPLATEHRAEFRRRSITDNPRDRIVTAGSARDINPASSKSRNETRGGTRADHARNVVHQRRVRIQAASRMRRVYR